MTKYECLVNTLLELASRAAEGAAYTTWDDKFARKEVREVWENTESAFRKKRDWSITGDDIRAMTVEQRFSIGFLNWNGGLILIPLWALNYIADGEKLTSIDGKDVIKGVDEFSDDVRGGMIAYGFTVE